MIFMGCFPKFGAVFAAMPGWLVGGLYMCLFGLICSCGLAQLQHVDLNSSRNLFILGFCIYNGLSLGGDPSPLRTRLLAQSFVICRPRAGRARRLLCQHRPVGRAVLGRPKHKGGQLRPPGSSAATSRPHRLDHG